MYIYLCCLLVASGDSVYLEKYRSVCRELELLKQQKNSEYDEELDDLRATKRNLERKVMTIDFDNNRNFNMLSVYTLGELLCNSTFLSINYNSTFKMYYSTGFSRERIS